MLLGTDPAEGIFRDSEFLHPDMDFRILFPRGWELVNTHQAVGATTPDGNGRIFLTARRATLPLEPADPDSRLEPESAGPAGPRLLTAKEAADEFIADHGDEFEVRVVRSQPLQIGSIDAYRIDVEGRMSGTAIGGQITFIPHNGLMFRVTGVAPAAQWSHYVGRARTVARTFRPLEAEERDSVEALHLRVVEALDGEDIASLSQRRGNAWSPGRTAVLNAIFVDTRFRQGDLVKIARSSRYRSRDPAAVAEQTAQP
jgi:predicted Zn-dependent protease